MFFNFNTVNLYKSKSLTAIENNKRASKPAFTGVKSDIFIKNIEEGIWKVVGKIKLQKRSTGELVDVNIHRFQKGNKIQFSLKHKDETLIKRECEIVKDEGYFCKEHGLHSIKIHKNRAGSDFKGLAKTMDTLAVKESLMAGLGGKVHLESAYNANPLHYGRGFKNKDYFSNTNFDKNSYDNQMKKLYSKYIEARKQGKNITQAKNRMASFMPTEVMVLPDDVLKQHIEKAKNIKYSL